MSAKHGGDKFTSFMCFLKKIRFITDMDTKHGAEGWHVVCLVLQWKAGNDCAQIVAVTKPTHRLPCSEFHLLQLPD
jgi:hypothetical protein